MSGLPNTSREITEGATIGVAIVGRDARGGLIVRTCNDAFMRMTDASRADTPALPLAVDAMMPAEAHPILIEKLKACFDGQTHTHRFIDGARSWRLALEPLRGPGALEAVHEVMISCIDDTSKRPLTREVEFDASRFRAVVDSAYDAIVSIDERHEITLFNRAAENLFGYTSAEALGRRIEMLLPERARAHHADNVRQFANSPMTNLRAMTAPRMDESNSVFGRHRDGTIIPVEIAISKIDVGGVVEFTAVIRDITERARLMELLKQQAVTDALTGLPNRREFIDFVEKLLATDEILSVFILDIDFFKAINDNYGHDIGDEVLRVLANVGKSIPLESMLFARWGGEEFVAALPGADASAAPRIADALRQRLERQDVEHVWRVKAIPFTVSIGVVTREPGERDVDALMRRADRALYHAKAAGRNRVEVR
ncbi:sensor domain-containing diguanylate cyclase [Caballeronia sp. ATUFL_F1_KS4A]|jgi:diguanylate cyclase (GGDEF)-like protein/PAS domain S-box-containing protein|uniref:sensor domain-containing diguanylate cyclase n=1 Tax=Caballeronia sp. ATUFL_F1_KS4A TaxID=2921768 RepID=UPI002028C082|nr:sensor domain-containing diguanylate cyclase [Caballeronia sp. ATUFL_F1_KS4A]